MHFKSKDRNKYIKNILQYRKEVPIKEMFIGFQEEVVFIYKSILNLSLNEIYDLKKVALIKKGYSFDLEHFLRLFG